MTTEIKLFVKECIEHLKGNDSEAIALQIQRKAIGAFKTHIPSLESELMELEEKVEDAELSLKVARMNDGQPINEASGRAKYIQGLINAKEALDDAKQKVEDTKLTIAFLKEQEVLVNQ